MICACLKNKVIIIKYKKKLKKWKKTYNKEPCSIIFHQNKKENNKNKDTLKIKVLMFFRE